jgi:VanZ family protein
VSLRERYIGSRLLKGLFWAAALFALVMALLPDPLQLPGNPNDKIQHMAAFAVLGMLGSLAYPQLAAVGLILGLSLFGAFIEVAQAIPFIHRDSDPLDWVADTIACLVVVLAVRFWTASRRSSRHRDFP